MLVIWAVCSETIAAAEPAWQPQPAVRRPIGILETESRDMVWVANRETGTLSQIDVPGQRVVAEQRVARSLSAVRTLREWCLLLDREQNELLLSSEADPFRVLVRHPVARDPVSIAVIDHLGVISVASLWSRRITLLKIDYVKQPPRLQTIAVFDLPFAPQEQCLLWDDHVLVADAFAGQLAVVDVSSRKIVSIQQINGHNIRGLARTWDGDEVVLTHQLLYPIGETKQSHITWGGVITNVLHTLPIRRLTESRNLDESRPERIHGSMWPLGEQGRAAGDPGPVACNVSGDVFVLFSGVNEVARKRKGEQHLTRTPVGLRPAGMHFNEFRNRMLVANTNDDTVSVINPLDMSVTSTIRLGPPVVKNPQQQGEDLFYDARLSFDGWYSCHSCHSNGHSNGLLNDNLGDDTFGTPKRILTLLGTGLSEPWAWNGSQSDLKNQIRKSVELSMAGPGKHAPPFDDQAQEALTAFVALLPPAPGISVVRENVNEPSRQRGEKLFNKIGCSTCHQAPSYASPLKFQVGLSDETGYKEFNPPSLRGVSQRGPFFHDNRAKQLRDVFEEHDHAGAADLKSTELDDLVEFLRSL